MTYDGEQKGQTAPDPLSSDVGRPEPLKETAGQPPAPAEPSGQTPDGTVVP